MNEYERTLKALDRALDRLDRAAKRPRRGRASTAPLVLALGLILGYQLLVRLVPMVWSSLLPGGLDQAAGLRGWPGLVWRLALFCHQQFLEVCLAAGLVLVTVWLISRRLRALRWLVWLAAVAVIVLDAGILFVALRTSMEATIQGSGL